DGLGVQALHCMMDWVRERWIPDMRLPKRAVETVAQMARFHPFMEKAGFVFLFETGSGRPALYLPLDETAREAIERFLQEDELARAHGGRLYRPRFTPVEQLSGPVVLHRVTKTYHNRLNLEGLSEPVREALEAFGVEEREIQTYVFRDADFRLEPGTVNAIVGASGSGKTTLLRLLIGAATGRDDPLYRADEGEIRMPDNVRLQALIPGEAEPELGTQPVLESLYRITGDAALAIEILNAAGLADAVLFRAPYTELSTGQKARVQLAWALAHRPNLLLIDEFAAHLDPRMAARVGRKLAELARTHGITLVLVTHDPNCFACWSPTPSTWSAMAHSSGPTNCPNWACSSASRTPASSWRVRKPGKSGSTPRVCAGASGLSAAAR
ncbi:ATP-binding cassette domain-containing protein, partial [Rhodothermus marinus]|uniref:ATP-binding cassette domain-containing protein n=1 Tax=Rhodothermus marinus TaxID=29549 RepID=UPI000A885351